MRELQAFFSFHLKQERLRVFAVFAAASAARFSAARARADSDGKHTQPPAKLLPTLSPRCSPHIQNRERFTGSKRRV